MFGVSVIECTEDYVDAEVNLSVNSTTDRDIIVIPCPPSLRSFKDGIDKSSLEGDNRESYIL